MKALLFNPISASKIATALTTKPSSHDDPRDRYGFQSEESLQVTQTIPTSICLLDGTFGASRHIVGMTDPCTCKLRSILEPLNIFSFSIVDKLKFVK